MDPNVGSYQRRSRQNCVSTERSQDKEDDHKRNEDIREALGSNRSFVFFFSSGYEVKPINDLFRHHECIHPLVSFTVLQISTKELFWVPNVFNPADII